MVVTTIPSFFYPPKGGAITHQGAVTLENKHYLLRLMEVEWYSSGKKFVSASATTEFTSGEIGLHSISASATYSIVPREGRDYKCFDEVCFVWVYSWFQTKPCLNHDSSLH